MEYVPFCFMEEVIENVFFHTAQRLKPWTESVHFSELPIWSNVAVDDSRRNRYVRLFVDSPIDGTEDSGVLSYRSVPVHDSQHFTWAAGRLEDLPLKRNILTAIEDAVWRYRGCSTEDLFKLFEEKNLQFSSSVRASFSASFREDPAVYGLLLKVLRKGATVSFPKDFPLSELIDLKRKHGLARHQLNVRRATADDQDLSPLLEAIPEFNFEHFIIITVPNADDLRRCAWKSGLTTLEITAEPENAAAILQFLAHQSCSFAIIADLRLCRALSQCERSRAALKGQNLCILLNNDEHDSDSFRFVFESFDSSLVFQKPKCCAWNNPYRSESSLNQSHYFDQLVWRLADETRNRTTTDRCVEVLCSNFYSFRLFHSTHH